MAEFDSEASDTADICLLTEQAPCHSSAQVLLLSKLRAVSRRMGFPEVVRERMGLVCQEMVSNQMKYAEGSGLVQVWEVRQPRPTIDLFAMDFGPGIPNLPAAMDDGYTTSGTMGKGLGAIRRLASESEFYTVPRGVASDAPWHGMAAWARFHVRPEPKQEHFQIGRYMRAYADSPYNGDCMGMHATGSVLRWLHMDGLGHGAEAAGAVNGHCNVNTEGGELKVVLEQLSQRMNGTRGAVGLVGEVDATQDTARIVGVGDMNGYVIANGERHNISFAPGVLGHAHRRCEAAEPAFPDQALLLTCSDGIRRNWTLRQFPSLWRLHPQFIALLLGQVLGRSNDDKSLFTIRKTLGRGA
ncbi:hypothetical protein [Thioalkalivibrio sp. ALMg13-2]|uniref:hypothetical protein n=1 Tax=Thioalkalivibrio sp. ALMg13-2 TaxID=1158167 RepID=UPI0003614740|nr:hypothetical protein [Thioalkalivibrio sp. ALMg13-2]